MPDKIKDHIKKRTIKDLYVICSVVISSFIIFCFIDTFELLYKASRKFEQLELDEIIPTLIVSSFCFIAFSYRRWKEAKYLSLYCEELSLIDPLTHLPNRRVIEKLLTDLPQSAQYPVSLILIDIQGLQSIKERLGLSLAEHSLIQYLNHVTDQLTASQLIAQWHSEQFIIYCPDTNINLAKQLINELETAHQHITNSILSEIEVTYAYESIFSDEQVSEALAVLEDNLHKSHLFNKINN
ncbi:diguanylate cyclase [Pseudoalteromonas sp. C2R02]|uniref:diguanylate cyclase domain-containing protein n=1 Tax=Pseudoalteromonas sp. C2R02 TaxID=2841565 RepID=UPI001C096F96|nr:diguanylate cyclase [Pseudoalteromonas sp. C2R02]MBU2970742.1 diguanylate cyclase [Pseudoalteromonas sp. C2R02]